MPFTHANKIVNISQNNLFFYEKEVGHLKSKKTVLVWVVLTILSAKLDFTRLEVRRRSLGGGGVCVESKKPLHCNC